MPKVTKEYQRKRDLLKYGISPERYQELLEDCGGLCNICFMKEKTRSNRSRELRNLCVDHDHKTGKVRGLLCSTCNTALGKFNDDVGLLVSAIAYLQKEHLNVH